MTCLCGYMFQIESRSRDRKSFAVIADVTYRRFLGLERKVDAATTREERLKAIARSADLVGSLRTCPDCARLVLIHPGGGQVEFYVREKLPDV